MQSQGKELQSPEYMKFNSSRGVNATNPVVVSKGTWSSGSPRGQRPPSRRSLGCLPRLTNWQVLFFIIALIPTLAQSRAVPSILYGSQVNLCKINEPAIQRDVFVSFPKDPLSTFTSWETSPLVGQVSISMWQCYYVLRRLRWMYRFSSAFKFFCVLAQCPIVWCALHLLYLPFLMRTWMRIYIDFLIDMICFRRACVVQGECYRRRWYKMLQAHPLFHGKHITISWSRKSGYYCVDVRVSSGDRTYSLRGSSMHSYDDAMLSIVPPQAEIPVVQGLLKLVGVPEDAGTYFVKESIKFAYFYYSSTTVRTRIVCILSYLDSLMDMPCPRWLNGAFSSPSLSHVEGFEGFPNRVTPHAIMNLFSQMFQTQLEINIGGVEPSSWRDDLGTEAPLPAIVQGLPETISAVFGTVRSVATSAPFHAVTYLMSLLYFVVFVFPTLKSFDLDAFRDFEKHASANPVSQSMGLAEAVMRRVELLATCACEFARTRDLKVFLSNDREIEKFLTDARDIGVEVSAYAYQARGEVGSELGVIIDKLMTLIRKGSELANRCSRAQRGNVNTTLFTLGALMTQLQNSMRSSTYRKTPFAVLINGTPGIGKSSVMDLIARQFSRTNPVWASMSEQEREGRDEPPLEDSGIYLRTANEQYWSGWVNSNWAVLYDDIAQVNPKIPDFGEEINEIIHVVNTVPYFPAMADVESKGKMFVAPQLVLATTNNPGLNANFAVNDPAAVLRRFPYVITPFVRPEFCIPNTNMLDGARTEDNLDLWTFRVDRVIVVPREGGRSTVQYEMVLDGVSTARLLSFIHHTSLAHFRNQRTASRYLNQLRGSPQCPYCSILSCLCSCERHVQSPDLDKFLKEFPNRPTILPVEKEPAELQGQYFGSFVGTAFRVMVYPVTLTLLFGGAMWRFRDTMTHMRLAYRVYSMVLPSFGYRRMSMLLALARSVCRGGWLAHRLEDVHRRIAPDSYQADRNAMHVALVASRLGAIVPSRVVRASRERVMSRGCKAILLALGCVVIVALARRYLGGLAVQGGEISKGTPVPPPPVPFVNTWAVAPSKSTTLKYTEQQLTVDTTSFSTRLRAQVGRLRRDGSANYICTINVFGNYWLVPRHFIMSIMRGEETVTVFLERQLDGGFGTCKAIIDRSVIFELDTHNERHDAVLLQLPTQPGHDLTPFMMDPDNSADGDIYWLREGSISPIPATCMRLKRRTFPELATLNSYEPSTAFPIIEYKSECDTQNGDCGSLLASIGTGRVSLYGYHVGRVTDGSTKRLALRFPKNELVEFRTKHHVTVQGPICVERPKGYGSRQLELKLMPTLHPKCPLRFFANDPLHLQEGSSFLPYGQILNCPQRIFKTEIVWRPFAEFWRNRGYVTDKIPPVLGGSEADGKCPHWLPRRTYATVATTHKDMIPPVVMSACFTHYAQRLKNGIHPEYMKRLGVMTLEQNMNGIDGDSYLNSVNFHTGAGYPYMRPKDVILVKDETDPQRIRYTLPPYLQERIDEFEMRLADGQRANFIFNATLKDDVISETKLRNGKLRMFQAVPIEGLILIRKYFLTMVATFQTFHFVTECAVGMDATGPDWRDVYMYLHPAPGWRIFCGDYSNYDQRMSASMLERAWELLIQVCEASDNFTDVDLRIMRGLASECTYPLINFFGDLIQASGTNPSGHPLTVIINSICNSVYLRIAWLIIFGDLNDFDRCVRLVTYGDDNVVSVHPDVQDRYNLVTVSEALARCGIVYTDAAKSGIIRKFCDEDQVTFLKRSFVKTDFGFYAPLERASLCKTLALGKRVDQSMFRAAQASALGSVMREAFEHGPEFMNEFLGHLEQCLDEFGLRDHMEHAAGGVLTYEHMREERAAKYRLPSKYDLLCLGGYQQPMVSILDHTPSAEVGPGEDSDEEYFLMIDIEDFDPDMGHSSLVLNQKDADGTSYLAISNEFGLRDGERSSAESTTANPKFHIDGGDWYGHPNSNPAWMSVKVGGFSPLAISNQQELYSFNDEGEATLGYSTAPDQSVAMTEIGSLEGFFSRPLRIDTISLVEGVSYTGSLYNPWNDFFGKPQIKSKLMGFSRLHVETLCLRFVVNGSPFRYGDLMVSYRPLCNLGTTADDVTNGRVGFPFFSGGSIAGDYSSVGTTGYPGGKVPGTVFSDKTSLMARSQRMHFHIKPQVNGGGEMRIPFMSYRDCIPLVGPSGTSGAQWLTTALKEMGTLCIEEVVPLRSTAAANSSPVTITIYAWAEGVRLWGPSNATVQGIDEFTEAPAPSKVASAAAEVAGQLSSVPPIAPMARATQGFASAAAGAFRFLGWSNPPIVESTRDMAPRNGFINPSPVLSQQVDVLALDPRNETSVDPRSVGCSPVDELAVESFCSREAIVAVVDWNVADPTDTWLFQLPASPAHFHTSAISNSSSTVPAVPCYRFTATPATYAAQMFRFWRGDMVVKVRIVASQFHRGRLRLQWDPSVNTLTASDTSSAVISEVFDISAGEEAVFTVPYMGATGMLPVAPLRPGTTSTLTLRTSLTLSEAGQAASNGIFGISVLNELQCGDTTASASIIVSVAWKNMKFAVPVMDGGYRAVASDETWSEWSGTDFMNYALGNTVTIQGGDNVTDKGQVSRVVPTSGVSDVLPMLYSGEAVPSLRSLLHRTCLYRNLLGAAGNLSLLYFVWPRFPTPFMAKGLAYMDSSILTGTVNGPLLTNQVATTPISYLTACFVGHRGSLVWHATAPNTSDNFLTLSRANFSHAQTSTTGAITYGGLNGTATTRGHSAVVLRSMGSGVNGMVTAANRPNGVASAVFPMYQNMRMLPGDPIPMYDESKNVSPERSLRPTIGDKVCLTILPTPASGVTANYFVSVSAGHDFSVFGFVNVPDIYLTTKV